MRHDYILHTHTHPKKYTYAIISSSVDTDFSRIMLNLLGYCLEIWLHQPEYKHLKILRGQVVFFSRTTCKYNYITMGNK